MILGVSRPVTTQSMTQILCRRPEPVSYSPPAFRVYAGIAETGLGVIGFSCSGFGFFRLCLPPHADLEWFHLPSAKAQWSTCSAWNKLVRIADPDRAAQRNQKRAVEHLIDKGRFFPREK